MLPTHPQAPAACESGTPSCRRRPLGHEGLATLALRKLNRQPSGVPLSLTILPRGARRDKPCHHFLYSGGEFVRLYPVNPSSMSNHATKTKNGCACVTRSHLIFGDVGPSPTVGRSPHGCKHGHGTVCDGIVFQDRSFCDKTRNAPPRSNTAASLYGTRHDEMPNALGVEEQLC
jgi:hypothetical protein